MRNRLAAEDVLPACQITLKNLQLTYLDLYLVRLLFVFIHCVTLNVQNYYFGERYMEDIVQSVEVQIVAKNLFVNTITT